MTDQETRKMPKTIKFGGYDMPREVVLVALS